MAEIEKCSKGYCDIPGGTFQMGSTNGDYDEQPVKNVTMTGFQLGQTEVSVADYQAHCRKKASGLFGTLKSLLSGHGWDGLRKCTWSFSENQKGGNFPVVGLSFDQKRAYCQAKGGDLPTAAQLHFASRFDDQDSATGKLVIRDNGFRSTEPVNGGYKNRFGVSNLLGNVWESALDAYDEKFYKHMPLQDPYNSRTGQWFELEEFSGGSFFRGQWDARPANRLGDYPGEGTIDTGFRCARPLPQNSKK